MSNYLKGHGPRATQTPQSQPLPGSNQVANNAGGFAWEVTPWTRLDRFLVLGTEGGSYYVAERKLTADNISGIEACLAEDGPRVVKRVVEISAAGRAPKNDPALFGLALCASWGDQQTRQAALAALPKVARIGTHLFHFLAYVQEFRGWGRSLRKGVAAWYQDLPAAKLAYQAVKYQQRDGWSHRDALRLAHPKTVDGQRNALYHWIVKGWPDVGAEPHPDEVLGLIWAFERAKRATKTQEIVQLITDYDLPREAIPTLFLHEKAVWAALLEKMPLEAMIRNLATMTRVELLTPGSKAEKQICERLSNQDSLRRSRIHPLKVLAALLTYQSGHGVRGSGTWSPLPKVLDALDAAFYRSFGNVEPSGKRLLLAVDVSGSMTWGTIAGTPGLTPRIGAAALALITAATEKDAEITAFSEKMIPLNISSRQRLDAVVKTMDKLPFGGTDCALPMIYAQEKNLNVDGFIVLTDSETWFGQIHPAQALQQYREKKQIAAKFVIVGMQANNFSIADPEDAGMLDLVGFDTNTPQLISDFVAGRI